MTLTHYGEGGGLQELTNYLKDDWGDDALTGRTNPETGQFLEQTSGGVGDLLKGMYRPEWKAESGSPSASSGKLQLSAGGTTSQTVSTPSNLTTGSFELKFQFNSDPTNGAFHHSFICSNNSLSASVSTDAGYEMRPVHDGSYYLTLRDNGTATNLISSTWADDLNQHTITSTRDEDSNFELFLDGTSQGTTTDSTYTTSIIQIVGNNATSGVAGDDFLSQ